MKRMRKGKSRSFSLGPIALLVLLRMGTGSVIAVTPISPADLHARLDRGDSLLLLDVRERSEYRNGHIAEPTGQLPLTPANMPWNSNVLSREYNRLPHAVDIVVYCGSGGRSAAASSFLESNGFARIYNMTGGFSAWTYERRTDGFGDHSGLWVQAESIQPSAVDCSCGGDSSGLVFPSGALSGPDSAYLEFHCAPASSPVPPGVPVLDVGALFRITLLDPFGISMLDGDSLVLREPVSIRLVPVYPSGVDGSSILRSDVSVLVPGRGWLSEAHRFDGFSFFVDATVLRKWIHVGGSVSTAVEDRSPPASWDIRVFPNPFNGSIEIVAPPGADMTVVDANGRFIERLESNRWIPGRTACSGLYFIRIRYADRNAVKKITYVK